MGGMISVAYMIYGFRNFCQNLKEFTPSYQSIVNIHQITQVTPPKSSKSPIITDQTGSVVDIRVYNLFLQLATLALDVIIQVCCLYKRERHHNND